MGGTFLYFLSVSSYSNTIGKDFLLIYFPVLSPIIRKVFCILLTVSRYVTCYPTTVRKDF